MFTVLSQARLWLLSHRGMAIDSGKGKGKGKVVAVLFL
jgi:hypothetical protein